MHYPSPQWLAKLMDYIHLAQQMADAGNFTKAMMVFHPGGESCSVPAKDRRNAWTLGGIAIDQVSKYKVPRRSVPGRRIMAGTRKALAKMQAAYGFGGHCCHAAVCRQRSDCSWFRPSSIPRSYGAEVWNDEGGQRQDVSGRKESSPQHSSPASPRLLF
jgi:hypothetical protein